MERKPQAPEIQTMYNVPLPVSALRTRIRQEFERHRFTNQLPVVDVLLFKSHAEYQVRNGRLSKKDHEVLLLAGEKRWHANRGTQYRRL